MKNEILKQIETQLEKEKLMESFNDEELIIKNYNDNFIKYYTHLLTNKHFINSQYKRFDLELLKYITDEYIFIDLYQLMTNKKSINGRYHVIDALKISKTQSNMVRELLLKKACDKYSLNSNDHEYDMTVISKLEYCYGTFYFLEHYEEINYYLFNEEGINDPKRKEKIEQFFQGIMNETKRPMTQFAVLQKQIEDMGYQIINLIANSDLNFKSKILGLFKEKR